MRCGPTRAMASSFLRFLDHTQRRITVGRTPLDGWSARRRDLYLTTHNNHNRHTSMPPVGFEPTISASERPQTYALDRAATGPAFCFYNTNRNARINDMFFTTVPCVLRVRWQGGINLKVQRLECCVLFGLDYRWLQRFIAYFCCYSLARQSLEFILPWHDSP